MKKITALAIAVMMLVSVLTSCTITVNNPGTSTTEAATTVPETTKSAEQILEEKKSYYENYYKSEDMAPASSAQTLVSEEAGKSVSMVSDDNYFAVIAGEQYIEVYGETERLYAHILSKDAEKGTVSEIWSTTKADENLNFKSLTGEMTVDYFALIKEAIVGSKLDSTVIIDGKTYDLVKLTVDNSEEGTEAKPEDLQDFDAVVDPDTHKLVKITIVEESESMSGEKSETTTVITYEDVKKTAIPDVSSMNAAEQSEFQMTVGLGILALLFS